MIYFSSLHYLDLVILFQSATKQGRRAHHPDTPETIDVLLDSMLEGAASPQEPRPKAKGKIEGWAVETVKSASRSVYNKL